MLCSVFAYTHLGADHWIPKGGLWFSLKKKVYSAGGAGKSLFSAHIYKEICKKICTHITENIK